MVEPTKDNTNIVDQKSKASGNEPLPTSHAPTVPLPKKDNEPSSSSEKVAQITPKAPDKKESSTKPKDVKLPEKGQPEIFLEDKPASNIPMPKIEPPKVKNDSKRELKGVQPIMDAGGVKKTSKKKILKYIGLSLLGLVLLGGLLVGFTVLRNMITSGEIPDTTEIPKLPEESEKEEPKDFTSLDALDGTFTGFGGLLEVLEADAEFESKLDLSRNKF